MSEIISKELLSEVLKIEIKEIKLIRDNRIIQFETYQMHSLEEYEPVRIENISTYASCSINIHELAHKCKEWALNKHDCLLKSYISDSPPFLYGYCYMNNEQEFCEKTEPEAIFKACEWILKEQL